jgi:hypothetical protein
MPKQISQDEIDEIVRVVSCFPDGASIEDLLEAPELALERRSLQRRLARLVEQGRLIVEGHTWERRYRLPVDNHDQPATGQTDTEIVTEGIIHLSPAAQSIRRVVRQNIGKRQPVSYSREFLDAYRPNESFYLPESVRDHLMDVGRPLGPDLPAGTYVQQIYNRVLIDLTWNSSRLEGNTYSLLETQRLLYDGKTAEGKDLRETQMILNHKLAIEMLVGEAEEIGFNRYTICNLHALLSDNLLDDPQACGRVRSRGVGIGGTTYRPLEVPQLIDECFQQILDTAEAITDPFEQGFFIMIHLPYLQPFEDVNKRVSRLAANIPLIRQNLSPISFVDVPARDYIDGLLGVYELNQIDLLRDVFVWAYERSSAQYAVVKQSLGEPDPFRLRYREVLMGTVAEIVKGKLDRQRAGTFIRQRALDSIEEEDRLHFAEVVDTELRSLHEGNIARYRLRPSEYQVWRENW